MPRGVYVFEVIEDLHIRPSWVREVLGISPQRYSRLKAGRVLFTREEAERLVAAMRQTYRIGRGRLFEPDAEVLPPRRLRRSKRRSPMANYQRGAA